MAEATGSERRQLEESAIIPASEVRGSSGPRTKLGKARASRNATKHGIFSKVVLLDDESPRGYKELLSGLQQSLRPVGALEDLLVETLATTAWRKRRFFLMEKAGIQGRSGFFSALDPEIGLVPPTLIAPVDQILDRLLRYEAHLDRILDRTLSQLERVQRMRLGQSPPLESD